MVSRFLLLFLILLITLMVLAVVAFSHFGLAGLAGAIGLVLIFVVLVRHLAVALLRRLFTAPFLAKGSVLKNASAAVHTVTITEPPRREEPDEMPEFTLGDEAGFEDITATSDEDGSRNWYHIDVTITPRDSKGPFALWEPGDLALVGPDAKGNMLEEDDDFATIDSTEIMLDGQWQSDEIGKYPGEQRLRLLAGVRPGVPQLQFRYYFELFGRVEIPY